MEYYNKQDDSWHKLGPDVVIVHGDTFKVKIVAQKVSSYVIYMNTTQCVYTYIRIYVLCTCLCMYVLERASGCSHRVEAVRCGQTPAC